MYRVVIRLVLIFLCLLGLSVGSANAWDKTLVTINGVEYTDQDYRNWWRYWQDPGMEFFETPQEFIDFHLLAEQGRQMEYHLTPEFQRKVAVFLKVRALGRLKYEVADSKIKVSEEQVREVFEKEYAPVWFIQVLTYNDQAKAGDVFEKLNGFNGQKAGRLVFADQAGVNPEEGGPVSYEEVEVNPSILARVNESSDRWLEVVSTLEKGFVAEPFLLEETGNYILVRMDDITAPTEEAFKKLRKSIYSKLVKAQRSEFTREFIENLKIKYHVTVNEDLLSNVTLEGDHSPEFLAESVVEMDGMSLSVEMLLHNMEKQQALRQSLSDDELRRMVVSFFVSNSLTDREALARHYEEKPPLKIVYDFYIDNNLRKFLNGGIAKRVEVTDVEIKAYYKNNLTEFTQPERISYVMIKGSQELLDEIGRAVGQGMDFFDQARDNSLDAEIKTEGANTLKGELAEALASLRKGETAPLTYQGRPAMVRLVDRAAGSVAPFERVRSQIEKSLRQEKSLAAKAAYLAKARAVADVEVKQRVWNKLKKEY